ncbi:MAG: Fic family protein [Alphaproteobacteria bacterium]
MSMYIYESADWPNFTWNESQLAARLIANRFAQGRLIGRMEALGFELRDEAVLETLAIDIIKSSEIEGEFLNREQVRSSLAHRLGMDIGSLLPVDRHIEGIVEMILDATQNYAAPLSQERLYGWHAALFPTGYSGLFPIKTGAWRDGPMNIVSGPYGRERIHYQAPSAASVPQEMTTFLDWFNNENTIDPIIKAGVAHLWFVTIHPFDDGNGRIGRAIADMALARSEQTSQRFYSLSRQIQLDRTEYYKQLESTQHDNVDITSWLYWFLGVQNDAINLAQDTLEEVLFNARFWENHKTVDINERQRKIINKLLDGFDGKLTSSKWAKVCKCSQDTANRDINDLVNKGILKQNELGGRSTSYALM